MWCKNCDREVAAVPRASGDVSCPFCDAASEYSSEKSDRKQNPTSKLLRTDRSHMKRRPTEEEIASTAQSNSMQRQGHDPSFQGLPHAYGSSQSMHHRDSLGTIASQSWINLAGFFVIVFLVGQGLMVWSFLAGHFGAWALGQTSIIFGMTATLWLLIRKTATLADQNRVLTYRVTRLNRLLNDQHESLERSRSQASNQQVGRGRN